MAVSDLARIEFADIKPAIGSLVHADKATLLSGEHGTLLRDLLEERGVLVLPEIHFTDEEHVAFTRTLGTYAREMHGQDIYKITLDVGQNATAEYLKGAFYWHFDGYMSSMPIRASLLASKVLSPAGTGNTDFANTYAAYDALSADDKSRLEGLKAVHSVAGSLLFVDPQPTYQKWREWLDIGRKELPLVWNHKSGRKSLVIGNSASGILGMDPLESTDLLIRLRDFATRPEFTYSHQWKVGDLVIWDNTGTLHRAAPYPLDCGRLLHRTKLEGEEPFS